MEKLNLLFSTIMEKGVVCYTYQQYGVLKQYEAKKIPDDKLRSLKKEDLQKYVNGLYLCSCEMANDWSKGLEMLKELGFQEKTETIEHRRFISLVWEAA